MIVIIFGVSGAGKTAIGKLLALRRPLDGWKAVTPWSRFSRLICLRRV